MEPLFKSYFIGGFECSTQRRRDGAQLDLISATRHDAFAEHDYRALLARGISTVRDGVRWHLIESTPGEYRWDSFLPMLRAAQSTGVQPVWDLCHYGWPSDVDIWSPAFPKRFSRFAAAVARLVRDEYDGIPYYCPVNEISFWAWAGGDMAVFGPRTTHRGMELKKQLVRASLAAMRAIRAVDPRARFVHVDPVIHVVAGATGSFDDALHARQAQFEAWDMIGGRIWPELGGAPEFLDILGLNYYSDNQWFLDGKTIERTDPLYRPFRELLAEAWQRFQRPLFIAETGAEGDERAPWLRYIGEEVRAAIADDVPVGGICLYPITDYPGWEDERHCPCGLLGRADDRGQRPVDLTLANELAVQQARFEELDLNTKTRLPPPLRQGTFGAIRRMRGHP